MKITLHDWLWVRAGLLLTILFVGTVSIGGSVVLAQCDPADADGSGATDIDDALYIIAWIYSNGPEPVPCSYAVDSLARDVRLNRVEYKCFLSEDSLFDETLYIYEIDSLRTENGQTHVIETIWGRWADTTFVGVVDFDGE